MLNINNNKVSVSSVPAKQKSPVNSRNSVAAKLNTAPFVDEFFKQAKINAEQLPSTSKFNLPNILQVLEKRNGGTAPGAKVALTVSGLPGGAGSSSYRADWAEMESRHDSEQIQHVQEHGQINEWGDRGNREWRALLSRQSAERRALQNKFKNQVKNSADNKKNTGRG